MPLAFLRDHTSHSFNIFNVSFSMLFASKHIYILTALNISCAEVSHRESYFRRKASKLLSFLSFKLIRVEPTRYTELFFLTDTAFA